MRKEIKELLDENPLVDTLKEDLCHIESIEERIEYLQDLKEVMDVLIKEELEMWGEMFG